MTKKSKSYIFSKRFLDISIAIFALIVLSPVFLAVSLLYLYGANRGPVFYRQTRIGLNHKPFQIYKFRSMIVDADKKLYANPDLYAKFVANGYKLPTEEDPRITKLGAFLRKTSIDELPQFINILKGDMSIIGPRPVVENELVEYGDRVDVFLSVRPGAMGLWQASGRSTIHYPERAELEIEYATHANMWFDFKIIFMTIRAIFKKVGAM
ncbi:sugar transferase [Weissella viridescens]|jgi:lipopolysaccharide/colanic/teichoic acid biosynthesis glycosyltransferase|uniref:Undecaprenyl-phosphate galactose phosphotransferase n=1 Tax=Weissella viridescens TaxID=1629 RepID=A0A0R2H2F2_WEIVI|nr:sugar transferase [Weissella viridescens]KRN47107.1 undecaprenyl-phosphate galactose phosphotransferase [Weissella viridescens]MBX4172170.1 sugar transferase [Weissella viridescens]MCB6839793.1 sugar transferase [Weissella viridescens]MCB6846525.1 sugar transferase [Weissella viridescens]QOD85646.1 sugar transferase [Weissella viridescens]